MAAFSYTTGLQFCPTVRPGQVWRSPDTGNRWLVKGEPRADGLVCIEALDGGRFGDGLYVWSVEQLQQCELVSQG